MGNHRFHDKNVCRECQKSKYFIENHIIFDIVEYNEKTGIWQEKPKNITQLK